jgi:hypothetical protein
VDDGTPGYRNHCGAGDIRECEEALGDPPGRGNQNNGIGEVTLWPLLSGI